MKDIRTHELDLDMLHQKCMKFSIEVDYCWLYMYIGVPGNLFVSVFQEECDIFKTAWFLFFKGTCICCVFQELSEPF